MEKGGEKRITENRVQLSGKGSVKKATKERPETRACRVLLHVACVFEKDTSKTLATFAILGTPLYT